MYWIGYDIGSSSVKAALIDADNGSSVMAVQYPEQEMEIQAPKPGWAEQDPEMWWEYVLKATQKLLSEAGVNGDTVKGVGISYQMHGLVVVDKQKQVLRPSIIWCDSRAVQTGNSLFAEIGEEKSIKHLLNSPGNFTLSKLIWVKNNQPELYDKIWKIMLPGDFIAMKLTGDATTTISGLSEGIMWDFSSDTPADWLLEHAGISKELLPDLVPNFGEQGHLTDKAAQQTGLKAGIPVLYRAGDQPNNAVALNVFEPGEVAATGGTSGVVYAITSEAATKEGERINCFAHVNHSSSTTRVGKMLCINGTGIQYSWLRKQVAPNTSYAVLNNLAASVPVGSQGLVALPFGNGAERMLYNQNKGARLLNVNFNIHQTGHMIRAALEGIAFSFVYGMEILQNDGVELKQINAGDDNLFQAELFSKTIANLTGSRINIVHTTGAVGAARAAALASGAFRTYKEAAATDEISGIYEPERDIELHQRAYENWKENLEEYIRN